MRLSFGFPDYFRHRKGRVAYGPVFIMQAGVAGVVKLIIGGADQDIPNPPWTLEIRLSGVLRCELDINPDSGLSEYRATKTTELVSMVHSTTTDKIFDPMKESRDASLPFFFDLSPYLQEGGKVDPPKYNSDFSSHFTLLPPSILPSSLGSRNRGRTGNLCEGFALARAYYTVTATLMSDTQTMCQCSQRIYLIPLLPDCPPTCLADFGGEYQPCQRRTLRESIFWNRGDAQITIREPEQLTVKPDSNSSFAKLPVQLQLDLPNSFKIPANSALCVETDVEWRLRAISFVSIKAQTNVPTIKEALASPTMAPVGTTMASRTSSVIWRDWTMIDGHYSTKTRFESHQELLLSFASSDIMTPTFWSPYLSVRFTLRVQFHVRAPGTATIELEIPIQVGVDQESLAIHRLEIDQGLREKGGFVLGRTGSTLMAD